MMTFFGPIKFGVLTFDCFRVAYITQISSFQVGGWPSLPAIALPGCITAIVSGAIPFSLRLGLRTTRLTRSADKAYCIIFRATWLVQWYWEPPCRFNFCCKSCVRSPASEKFLDIVPDMPREFFICFGSNPGLSPRKEPARRFLGSFLGRLIFISLI